MIRGNSFLKGLKSKLTLLLCASFIFTSLFSQVSVSNASPTVTLSFNDERQEIDGFGASNAWSTGVVRNSLPSQSAQKEILDALFSTTNGAGLSMVRNRLPYDMMSESGTWNWNNWDINDTTWLFNKIKTDYNVTNFFTTPWTPPSFMKTGGRGSNGEIGGKLRADQYQAYADFLANYVIGFKNNKGIDISAISIQNEPNWRPEYESCEWTGEEFRTFIKNNLKPTFAQKGITAKVMMPEGLAFDETLAIPSLNDVDTRDRVDIIGVHQYGVDSRDPNLGAKWLSNTKKYNKKLWVTEVSLFDENDPTIKDGIYWAKMVHKDLTVAEVNAFCYWWLWSTKRVSEGAAGNREALITLHTNENGRVIGYDLNKRLYTLGQYSRFIRPGYKRINSDVEPAAGIYTTAYKDASNGKLVIVAINENENNSSLSFNINGTAIGSYTTYRTSDNENIADLGDTVVNGSTFNVSLKGKSVTTFYANLENMPVTGVKLNKNALNLRALDSERLIATINPVNATNKNMTWASNNTAIATVDNTGKVTAVTPGTAIISVTTEDSKFTDECVVTVVGESSGENQYVVGTTFTPSNLNSSTILTANVTVENINGGNDPVLAIAALYNEDDQMVNISYISKVIVQGKTETLHAGFKLPEDVTGHYVKVFVWDGENIGTSRMKPLSNYVELQ